MDTANINTDTVTTTTANNVITGTLKENKAESPITTTVTSLVTEQPTTLITTTIPETATITNVTTNQTTTMSTTTKATTTTKTTTKTTMNTTPTTTFIITENETITSNYILPYVLTDDDWFMICKVVSSETGYCSEKQQKAVVYTIFNRIIHAATHENSPYPNSVYEILHQKNQYNAINYWRNDVRLQPGGSLWNNTMRIIKEAAYEIDFTNGAIGYYNPNMSGYLSTFENNPNLYLSYYDSTGRFFALK